jgi:GTPase Era involved in 16S rRNA processing
VVYTKTKRSIVKVSKTENSGVSSMPVEDESFIRNLISRSHWIFAKTMPENPHYYMLRRETDDGEFVRFVEIIRKFGYRQNYEGHPYTVLDVDEWFYWTMGAAIEKTILINRKMLKPDKHNEMGD